MSQVENTQIESDDDELAFDDMTIQQARKYAALYRMTLDKNSTKAEIIELLKAKRAKIDIAKVVDPDANNGRPKPGWTRIHVARDPMPKASNQPIYVNCNGYQITLPRGIDVDVPHKVVQVLNDSVEQRLVEDHNLAYNDPNRFSYQKVVCYPFQILDRNPGPDPRPGFERHKEIALRPRMKFRELFGYWPSSQQLLDAQRDGLLKIKREALGTNSIEDIISIGYEDNK